MVQDVEAVTEVERRLDDVVGRDHAHLPPLAGVVWFCACTSEVDCPIWVVTDGERPGSIRWLAADTADEGEAAIDSGLPLYGDHLSPLDALAWLDEPSGSGTTDSSFGDPEVLARFSAICQGRA